MSKSNSMQRVFKGMMIIEYRKKGKMKTKIMFLLLVIILFSIITVSALDDERQDRIDFGYVLLIKDIKTEPKTLVPGNTADLKIVLENNANFRLFDIRSDLELPSGISFSNDVSKRKVFRMEAGEITEITYHLITSPTISEGVYDGNFSIEYLNHVATERTETYSFGLTVKSDPVVFVEIEESKIYDGVTTGEITLKFVNNDIGDIKFLTVHLEETEDYEIIGPKKQYIGDLDSDDFETVDYKLKINEEKESVNLIIKMDYKDALNNDHTASIETVLKIRDGADIGVKNNTAIWVVVIIIVVLVVAYIVYRRIKKSRRKKKY